MGRTQFAGLFELIQICCTRRRDVAITITQKGHRATILIHDGNLCDAECGELRGDDAIYEICAWENSYFEMVPLTTEVERTIVGSNTAIMVKAAEKTKGIGPPVRRGIIPIRARVSSPGGAISVRVAP